MNDFESARRRRKARKAAKSEKVQAALVELARELDELCRRHGLSAAMVRTYPTGSFGRPTEVVECSVNAFERMGKVSGSNAIGHSLEPLVSHKEVIRS